MKAYRIEQPMLNIDYLTSDFMDIWNQLDIPNEPVPYQITPIELTVAEFNEKIKSNQYGPKTID